MRFLLALSLLSASSPLGIEQALRELHAMDVRVAEMSHRIAVKGASLCPRRVRRVRMLLEDAALYSGLTRIAAQKIFGLGDYPVIVWPDALAGNEVRAIDGVPLGLAETKAPWKRSDAIRAGAEGKAVALETLAHGRSNTVKLTGDAGCPSQVQLLQNPKKIARADGQIVQVSTAMVEEAQDDDELAFVISHEMAHNILGHAAALDATGRRAKAIFVTEVEADRLSVKMMKAAGFDPMAASRFWTRFGKGIQHSLITDGTHMKTKARVAFLRDEALKLGLTPAQ